MDKGLVIKSTGSWYTVLHGGKEIACRIKGKLRLKDIATTNPVAVGDRVDFEMQADGTALIMKIEDRQNYIIRRSTRFHKEAILMAANIDQAFLVVSLKSPETPLEFIDRFLVSAEAYHIKSIILINKIDLLTNEYDKIVENIINTYSLAGYECIPISVKGNIRLDRIKELIQNNISLFAGNSGVGKSSLINALAPGFALKTGEISSYHQSGKHTTTFSELFCLNDTTYLIDSPGIRGFGLIDFQKAEIGLFFPEIFSISKTCRFTNCTHVHEPDCAVIEAVNNREIGESRYRSYVSMFLGDDSKHR